MSAWGTDWTPRLALEPCCSAWVNDPPTDAGQTMDDEPGTCPPDAVEVSSEDSFPASDAPGWQPLRVGLPPQHPAATDEPTDYSTVKSGKPPPEAGLLDRPVPASPRERG